MPGLLTPATHDGSLSVAPRMAQRILLRVNIYGLRACCSLIPAPICAIFSFFKVSKVWSFQLGYPVEIAPATIYNPRLASTTVLSRLLQRFNPSLCPPLEPPRHRAILPTAQTSRQLPVAFAWRAIPISLLHLRIRPATFFFDLAHTPSL